MSLPSPFFSKSLLILILLFSFPVPSPEMSFQRREKQKFNWRREGQERTRKKTSHFSLFSRSSCQGYILASSSFQSPSDCERERNRQRYSNNNMKKKAIYWLTRSYSYRGHTFLFSTLYLLWPFSSSSSLSSTSKLTTELKECSTGSHVSLHDVSLPFLFLCISIFDCSSMRSTLRTHEKYLVSLLCLLSLSLFLCITCQSYSPEGLCISSFQSIVLMLLSHSLFRRDYHYNNLVILAVPFTVWWSPSISFFGEEGKEKDSRSSLFHWYLTLEWLLPAFTFVPFD